ncbi:MAG: hypothetical protein QXV21_05405 [Candidatus Bathyarchaeia archaeon]
MKAKIISLVLLVLFASIAVSLVFNASESRVVEERIDLSAHQNAVEIVEVDVESQGIEVDTPGIGG